MKLSGLACGLMVAVSFAGLARAADQPPLTALPTGPAFADGSLAQHLSTNAAARTHGLTGGAADKVEVSGWVYDTYSTSNLAHLTNATWSENFWLKGVKGLSATCIGFKDRLAGQGLVTMISPRHCVFATHMHQMQDHFVAAFLDTNNVVCWRTNLQTMEVGNDTSVGILNADLPAAVGYLPVLPADFADYLPVNMAVFVQGIGMNQDLWLFSEPMTFGNSTYVVWNSAAAAPQGMGTNWNVMVRGGDSSAPAMLLVHDQLVLVSHNFAAVAGPNYALQIDAINQKMRDLSTENKTGTDYQLTSFSFADWPKIRSGR
jgi:hypothetical protein